MTQQKEINQDNTVSPNKLGVLNLKLTETLFIWVAFLGQNNKVEWEGCEKDRDRDKETQRERERERERGEGRGFNSVLKYSA